MRVKEIKVNIQGNFSNIITKDEYVFKHSFYDSNGMVNYDCKRRKANNKTFNTNVSLYGTGLIFNDTKNVYHNSQFIGNIKEVQGGFIPSNNLVDYHSEKIYKTFEGAKNKLLNDLYNKVEKASFGLLAQKKFYYTQNYLKDLSIVQMASLIEQFSLNITLSIRIVKKFLRSDITSYNGQGGFTIEAKP